jgi:hypothetical protein
MKAEEGGGQVEASNNHYSNMTTENTVIKSKDFGQEGIVEEKEIKIDIDDK